MSFLSKFKYFLGTDQKLKVVGFLVCTVLAAAMELLSLSLMIPLVMALLDASFLQKLPFLRKYEHILSQWDRQELIIGFFDTSLQGGETVDWLARLRNSGLQSVQLDVVTVRRRIHLTNTGRVCEQEEMQAYATIIRRRLLAQRMSRKK